MINNENVPFPQADDFEKIIEILNVETEDKLSNKTYMSKLLGDIHERQVCYYISAAIYLGILDKHKKFTEDGIRIRKLSTPEQKVELSIIIVSNPIFGKLYFTEKMLHIKLDVDDVIEIMKNNDVRFESEAMYKRRAQTVIGWVKWINSF